MSQVEVVEREHTDFHEVPEKKYFSNRYLNFMIIALIMVFALFGFETVMTFSSYSIWDDSSMFIRYADNLIHYGHLSWNPNVETGTYGLTSLLYLLIVLPIRYLTSFPSSKVLILSSYLSGILFFVLLWLFLNKTVEGNRNAKLFSNLFVWFLIGASVQSLPWLFASGMDTAFSLAYITGYLYLFKRCAKTDKTLPAFVIGILGGLAFYVRPDLLIYTAILPFILLISKETRKNGVIILFVSAIILGIELLLTKTLLHSILPLAFYAKSTNIYGEFFNYKYSRVSTVQFLMYLNSYWPMFLTIGLSIFLNRKNLKNNFNSFDTGVILATIIFLFYYLFVVVAQVMYYNQRFYYPTLPALAYLSCKSMIQIAEKLSANRRKTLKWGCSFVVIVQIIFSILTINMLDWNMIKQQLNEFDMIKSIPFTSARFLTGLAEFSKLPNDLVIATTEVGLCSLVAENKTVVDLAGLNETAIAHQGFDANYIFDKYRPDIIYMPHPDYRDMINAIIQNDNFKDNYVTYQSSGFVFAISADSKYISQMKEILNKMGLKPTKDLRLMGTDVPYGDISEWPLWAQWLEINTGLFSGMGIDTGL